MNRVCILIAALIVTASTSRGNDAPTLSKRNPVPISRVAIDDPFWTPKLKVWREVTIDDCFTKFENDRGGAINNFDRVRDGKQGFHAGPEWYDGLIYEMIRGSADFLAAQRDAELEKRIDNYIDRIAAAAAVDPDGYLNTWTQLTAPDQRWGLNGGNDVQQHDVYNAGALVEAAVHYYLATGKTKLLVVATKLAHHMTEVMGPPPKQNVVPGHSLSEEAFVKLYRLFREQPRLKREMPFPVDERRFLQLTEFWIENRGQHAGRRNFGAYAQDHLPVLQQKTIEGHAVRATLLCAGMVAAADVNGRTDYITTAERLWENMVFRRMYIIGGLGAVAGHEGFGPDYELPNNGYLETCAAIGAGFFHHNLGLATGNGRYGDELERVLYNAVLPGVSLSGNTYYYENPVESGSARQRWAWHDCPCCPPMFLKIMGELPSYIYSQTNDAIDVNLFISSRASIALDPTPVTITQTTRYPWDGEVTIRVDPQIDAEFNIRIRVPGWCQSPHLSLNGEPMASFRPEQGFAELRRKWQRGDQVTLDLPMPVQRIKSHPRVQANLGRVALQRGPLVYCLEGVDNDGQVVNRVLPADVELTAQNRPDLLGGIVTIAGRSELLIKEDWPANLYQLADRAVSPKSSSFVAIPYFANSNRTPGAMQVWIAENPTVAQPRLPTTIASRAFPSASHCWRNDTVSALNDQRDPANSDDQLIPRFTWWDHRGTNEWVAYQFSKPETVSSVAVYWWDERRIKAHCRVPDAWHLQYFANGEWQPVSNASSYGTELDQFNRVTFDKIETTALRIEVQLQAEWSGGILEWRVE